MKKIVFILIALVGLGLAFSCQKEKQDPVLNMSNTVKPMISSPAGGSEYTLLQANADSVLFSVEWSAAIYDLTTVEDTKYSLEIDLAGNNFADFSTLVSSTATSYDLLVSKLNTLMISKWELKADTAYQLEMRVRSFLNTASTYSYAYSDVISLTVTAFSEEVAVKHIYLIGEATTIGWDNTIALPMAEIAQGKYAIVETLLPEKYFKFISFLGKWAPQWGTDDTQTPEAGPLVYRPTEAVDDPPAILSGSVGGAYYIEADTVALTYKTFLTSGELYLVGDGCSAGWDNANGIPFTQGPDHVFTLETNLTADAGLKFLEVPGAWAPQWGTDAQATGSGGMLVYRPSESVPDPPEVPTPDTDGTYVITVDMTTMTYTIKKP